MDTVKKQVTWQAGGRGCDLLPLEMEQGQTEESYIMKEITLLSAIYMDIQGIRFAHCEFHIKESKEILNCPQIPRNFPMILSNGLLESVANMFAMTMDKCTIIVKLKTVLQKQIVLYRRLIR